MAVYAYIAAASGRPTPVRGTVVADSPRHARDQLRSQGLSIHDITEQRPASASWWRRSLARRDKARVTCLLQEMSTLLSADIPLLEAMDTIIRQHKGRFRQSILLLREHVAAGGGLADGMAQQPEMFDSLCRSIVEVGEKSGTLDSALGRLVEFRGRTARFKNRVASALMYPCIVLAAGLAASMFLMTYVLPNLLGVLAETGRLPATTLAVKAVADFLRGYWWALLLAAGGLWLAGWLVLRTESGRMGWHRLVLRIPLLGELIRKQTIARMATVMATLLKSDVVFIRAVQIARATLGNRVMRLALTECEQAVMAGRDIAVALEKTSAFPPLVIQVFAVGQASGKLDRMLETLAADYDTQVEIASSRLTALLEPVMTILLAFLVGFIAFATILPILEAGNVL
jgi:type II secretory pathway component PulF